MYLQYVRTYIRTYVLSENYREILYIVYVCIHACVHARVHACVIAVGLDTNERMYAAIVCDYDMILLLLILVACSVRSEINCC